jgi:hypothetical protein
VVATAIACGDDSDTEAGSSEGTSATGSTSETPPDLPDSSTPANCDPTVADDCGEGFKCAPVRMGPIFTEAVCIPVSEDALGPGDECELDTPLLGDGTSDPCDESSVCVSGNDSDPTVGVCHRLCPSGSDAQCQDPNQVCIQIPENQVRICAQRCDPLASDCPEGMGCYTYDLQKFACVPVLDDAGGHGHMCSGVQNLCEAGHGCYPFGAVAADGCGTAPCCTPYCDSNEPSDCPGAAQGEECVTFPQAAPQWAHVGVCALPP